MNKRLVRDIALATILLTGRTAWAEVTSLDRFELWNECGTVNLLVESLNKNAEKIELTSERVERNIRSRLRAARIYRKEAADGRNFSYIYVQITLSKHGYMINVKLKKEMRDERSGLYGLAVSWSHGGTGTHGGDAGYIIGHLSELIDVFIDEYIRVNESAC